MIFAALLTSISLFFFNAGAMMPNDARLESTAALVKSANPDFVYMTEEYTSQMDDLLTDNYPFRESATAHIDVTERFYSKYPILDVTAIGTIPSKEYTDAR